MVITGVVVKVLAGKEDYYVNFLKQKTGVTVEGTTEGNIAIVIEADNTSVIEKMTTEWTEQQANILGVFPVYISNYEAEKELDIRA